MSTVLRGNVAEAAVLNALVKADLLVLVPWGEGSPYDLMVDSGCEVIKVQVKCGRIRDNCIAFNTCGTDHGRGRQDYVGKAHVFGIHAPQLDRVFVVPVEECGRYVARLRLVPSRNNQQHGVRYAGDYALEDWARSLARPTS